MQLNLSLETLQRSTFLFERDSHGNLFDYSNERKSLEKKFVEADDKLQSRITDHLNRLENRSDCIENGFIPGWVAHLSTLVLNVEYDDEVKDIISGHLNEAYAFPFKNAVAKYILKIKDAALKENISLERKTIDELVNWYISRQLEVSSFVLHLSYLKSNLSNYSCWCKLFDSYSSDKNPWYAVTNEFPVLMRFLFIVDKNCTESALELISRLALDRKEIDLKFGIPIDSALTGISSGLSDPHRGGRSVMKLEFSNGESLIYKPKPLFIDAELNRFVSENPDEFGLLNLKILPREDYGWVEDAKIQPSSGYRNFKAIGKTSAFFWLLNATDLHSENIFCTKNGIYPLDLETILLPLAKSKNLSPTIWRNHSIYTTMLFEYSFGEKRKQNLSGFNPSVDLQYLGPKVEFELNDDKVVVKKVKRQQAGSPISELLSSTSLTKNCLEIEDGFEEATVKRSKGILQKFINDLDDRIKTRLVFRDTFFYARILERLRQPHYLRDGALISLDLLNLYSGVNNSSKSNDFMFKLIDDEIKQLLSQDIPYYSNEIGGLDLITSSGRIKDFFQLTGKKHSLQKIENIEASDIEEQISLIKISMGQVPDKTFIEVADRHEIQINPKLNLDFDILLELINLGKRIIQSGFNPSDEPCRWISMYGDVSGNESRIDVGELGFFSGSWGILLSLQAFSNVLVNSGVKSNFESFLDNQAKKWSKFLHGKTINNQNIIGFSGDGGEIFAQSVLVSLNRSRWRFLLNHIGNSLPEVRKKIQNDDTLDVIGGAAGLILGCEQFLNLDSRNKYSQDALTMQEECSKNLMKQAFKYNSTSVAWLTPSEKHPLLGFAHGWSGIVNALSITCNRTENIKLKEVITSILENASRFPHQLLISHGEWKDFREEPLGYKSLNRSWCNGKPGIIRGLIEIKDHWTPKVSNEFHLLVNSIVKDVGKSKTLRFCCGEVGNIDLLIDFHELTDNADFNNQLCMNIKIAISNVLNEVKKKQDKIVPELTFPGLFHGTSGILYTFSRLFLLELPSLSGHRISTSDFNKFDLM